MAVSLALAELEAVIRKACAAQAQWPAGVVAGIYAGVDYAIYHPEVAGTLATEAHAVLDRPRGYESLVSRLAGILRASASQVKRLPGATDEALVGGMVGLVGDHLRVGRVDRLRELRPELVLLTLLPYLGFDEAKRWADRPVQQTPEA